MGRWRAGESGGAVSRGLCRDTLYAAKWNQLISFRKHLPVAEGAAGQA